MPSGARGSAGHVREPAGKAQCGRLRTTPLRLAAVNVRPRSVPPRRAQPPDHSFVPISCFSWVHFCFSVPRLALGVGAAPRLVNIVLKIALPLRHQRSISRLPLPAVGQRPQDCVQDRVKVLAQILRQEAQDKIAVLL